MGARLLIVCGAVLTLAGQACGQGFVMPGAGPINRSMGGASVAAPLDASGAIYWNPATLSGLEQSRADIGVDLIYNRNRVNSVLLQGTPMQFGGSTDSNAGVWALPAINVAYKPQDSIATWGLGLNAIGGFFVNYPASTTNPIFTPPPPVGVGLGRSYTRLGILQIAPTLALELTDTLSIGVAPTVNVADLQANPFPFAPPDDANGDMAFSYPDGTGNRNIWGVGIQGGVFYESPSGFNLGASLKSPQWFERGELNATDEAGLPRDVSTQFTYPLIASVGAAYTAIDDVLFAVDVRYVDFDATQVFGEGAFTGPTGALRGMGWRSVWVVAAGTQFQLTDRFSVRFGYSWNQNPVRGSTAFFNALAPAIYQHVLNAGASWQFSRSLVGSLAYVHAFDNTIDGPYPSPGGPVPFSKVSVSEQIDAVVFGLSVLF